MDDYFSLSSRPLRKNFLSPVDIHSEFVSQFNTILNKTTASISSMSNVTSLLPFVPKITERWPLHIQQHRMYYSFSKKIKKSRRQRLNILFRITNIVSETWWCLWNGIWRKKPAEENCSVKFAWTIPCLYSENMTIPIGSWFYLDCVFRISGSL